MRPRRDDHSHSDFPSQLAIPETHWTLVVRAFGTSGAEAAGALRDLCETYWTTLYRIARKTSLPNEQALETVHDFLCDLLEGRVNLGAATQERGRFRNYLWKSFSNYLIDRHRTSTTQRSGGNLRFISMDAQGCNDKSLLEPVDHLTAEDAFSKSLAIDTFDRAMRIQREKWISGNEQKRYQCLTKYLDTELKGERSQVLANELEVSTSRCRGMVAEFRKEFRVILRGVIAETLQYPTPGDIDDELDWLWRSLQL